MAARSPRRVFAASFVVTVAVMPACSSKEAAKPRPEPDSRWSVERTVDKCGAQYSGGNPPPPQVPYPCPPGLADGDHVIVAHFPDAASCVVEDTSTQVPCPKP